MGLHTTFFPSGVFRVFRLTHDLIKQIISHLPFIHSTDYLTSHLEIINETIAEDVLDLIKIHFGEKSAPSKKQKMTEEQEEFSNFSSSDSANFEESFITIN